MNELEKISESLHRINELMTQSARPGAPPPANVGPQAAIPFVAIMGIIQAVTELLPLIIKLVEYIKAQEEAQPNDP